MATQANYGVYAGDAEPLRLTLTQYDAVSTIDLTTALDVVFEAKRVLSDPDPVAYISKSVQTTTITITGTPTGGAWVATVGGVPSADIPYNASAATVKTAIEAISGVGAGNSYVRGGPGPGTPWVIRLAGTAAGQAIAVAASVGSPLAGGTSPAIAGVATGGGVLLTVPAQGQITVQLLPADTASVTATLALQYAAKAFLADGSELTGELGLLTVTPTVVKKT